MCSGENKGSEVLVSIVHQVARAESHALLIIHDELADTSLLGLPLSTLRAVDANLSNRITTLILTGIEMATELVGLVVYFSIVDVTDTRD